MKYWSSIIRNARQMLDHLCVRNWLTEEFSHTHQEGKATPDGTFSELEPSLGYSQPEIKQSRAPDSSRVSSVKGTDITIESVTSTHYGL